MIAANQMDIGTINLSDLLARGASFKQYAKGDLIFSEGSECHYYHQLESGLVRWVNIDDEGRAYVQAFIMPGESFGEMPLFDNGPYASSSYAEQDCVVVRLKKENFLQMMAAGNQLLMAMTVVMARRLRYKFFMIKTLANPSPAARIERLLQYLIQEQRHICPSTKQLKLKRQQIADLCGLRVETVIRTILQMNDEGNLQIRERKIYLT